MREPMALHSSVTPAFDPASAYRFRSSGLRVDPPALAPQSPDASEPDVEGEPADAPQRYRTIWLSDIHLGSGGCQASYLLDFLRHHESEYLYLVGDVIDGWQLRKGWFWPQAHNDVVQKIL